MKIGKPLLLTTTSIGVVCGLYEGVRFAGGLVFLMLAMLLVVGAGVGSVVMAIRREARQSENPIRTGEPVPVSKQGPL